MEDVIEIGACYRDVCDGEVVRALARIGSGAWRAIVVVSTSHEVGTNVVRELELDGWRRVPDPTPAIAEDGDDLDLDQAADLVRDLRRLRLLCSKVGEGLSPLAEQHYLLALAQLEQAERSLRIAKLHEAQWIGARQMGRPFG